ncbi:hypothetical protein [Burkholderia stagnalis]|uniref:hypothetical protein n=1 Tax=Burkholderia stagnalis TaxID=1503054 RepID=UPI000F578293|nr:hypothetical protein [Burkholderia stagnalis]
MKKFSIAAILIISASCALPSAVWAKCAGSVNLPSQQAFFKFHKNEKSLDPIETKRLIDWATEMQKKYPVHQWLSISAEAQPDEDRPNDLAASRAVSLAKLALDDGLVRAPIELKTHVGSLGNPASYGDDARMGVLQLNPGCPNNCCDGD